MSQYQLSLFSPLSMLHHVHNSKTCTVHCDCGCIHIVGVQFNSNLIISFQPFCVFCKRWLSINDDLDSDVISPVFLPNAIVVAVANCIRIVCTWCGVEVPPIDRQSANRYCHLILLSLCLAFALRQCNSLPFPSPYTLHSKRRYIN